MPHVGHYESMTLDLIGGLIPLAAGDTVRITYAVAPTITFIPE